MSNSKLATVIDLSNKKWEERKYSITRITIHYSASVLDKKGLRDIINSDNKSSYNYGIANDGTICLFVDESHRSWSCGSGKDSKGDDNDHRAINIVVSNSAKLKNWPISTLAYNSLLNLCEDICRRNSTVKLKYDKTLSGSTLTMHKWFTNTECPGQYISDKYRHIVDTVNDKLKKPNTLYYPTEIDVTEGEQLNSAYDNAISGGTYISSSLIDSSKILKYVATIDRNSRPNFAQLKKLNVLGLLIEGGYLYNNSHKEVNYRNPNLASQVQQCFNNNLNYGLYFISKARSVEEANKELYHISLCLRKYFPGFGVWIRFQLQTQSNITQGIIQRYYDSLIKLGLQDKIGIYATYSELGKLDWETWKDKFYLWIDDHIPNISVLEQLLTPTFFKR